MSETIFIPKGEGKDYDYAQDHCYVKVSSKQTNGELCIVEDELKPGFFLPRHHHKIMTEVFYVLEGEIEFILDDQSILAKEGDTLTVPANIWHACKCEKGGRMMTIFKNGQFDAYLEKLSKMTEEQFADAELMKAVNAEFDIYNAE